WACWRTSPWEPSRTAKALPIQVSTGSLGMERLRVRGSVVSGSRSRCLAPVSFVNPRHGRFGRQWDDAPVISPVAGYVVQTFYLSSGCTLLLPENILQHPCRIAARRRLVRNQVQHSENDVMGRIACPNCHLSRLEHV